MGAAVQALARQAVAAGISVIPTKRDKRPALTSWSVLQTRLPTAQELDEWSTKDAGIGLVCGRVSGGLEGLDFDQRDAYEDFTQLCLSSGLGELLRRVVAGYLERSPRGVHILYRCPEARTTKLARREGSVAVETRGEGSYIIAAPSDGYELVCGGVASIVTITAEERELLHDVARALSDEGPDAIRAQIREERSRDVVPLFGEGERPGDEWAQHHDWPEILTPNGWTRLWTRGGVTYWRRPGKKEGVSATTNYADSGLLYVFTTSTAFEANRGYGKFGAYAILEHGGDFEAAARRLSAEGYGSSVQHADVDLSGFMAPQTPEEEGGFPKRLLAVPGILGALTQYTINSAPKPQPILALASAIATCGAVFGRRVRTNAGVWPNVFVIGLAETGAGKEATRSAPRAALRSVGLSSMAAVDDVTSDAAIFGYLEDHPSAVFMFDEYGHLVREFAERKGANICATMTKVYGLVGSESLGKTYAKDRKTNRSGSDVVIKNPALSVYGTSVPHRFWEAIDSQMVEDGFLNRYLVFASEDADPALQMVSDSAREVPAALHDMLEPWGPGAVGYGSLVDSKVPATPATYSHTDGSLAALCTFDLDVRRRRKESRDSGDRTVHDLWARARELAEKLALIRAAGQQGPDGGVISRDDVRWGVDVVSWCLESTARAIAENLGDSDHDRLCKAFVAWMRGVGRPVTKSELTRKFQRVPSGERASVLKTLVEGGQIVAGTLPGRSRPAKAFALDSRESGPLFTPDGETRSGEVSNG